MRECSHRGKAVNWHIAQDVALVVGNQTPEVILSLVPIAQGGWGRLVSNTWRAMKNLHETAKVFPGFSFRPLVPQYEGLIEGGVLLVHVWRPE